MFLSYHYVKDELLKVGPAVSLTVVSFQKGQYHDQTRKIKHLAIKITQSVNSWYQSSVCH